MKQYAWSRKSDDEIWYGGPCNSIKECVEEAQDEDYSLDDTFALGLIESYKVNYDFAQDIVERLCEDSWDEVGEASDGWLDSVKRAQLDVLNARITPIIEEWLTEIGEYPSFYKVLPFEECTLKEALELHKEKVATMPRGGKVNTELNENIPNNYTFEDGV
jgi:hypothetical protein